MQSQGSTFSQAPFDSLSSSGSLALSDLEPAEDDGEVFLTDGFPPAGAARGGGGVARAERSGGSESPGSQWACDGFAGKEEEEGYCERLAVSGGKVGDYAADTASQSSVSQGDLLFAQKCAELQGFVRPLLELLNGLKRGRFQRGLSSFQQNVAMDRIQRIVGILQRPNCGEKYLNTLLQVEMMLKMWFPQISAHSSITPSTSPPPLNPPSTTPPHKHRDQLHIPVKKRRLSWTGTDSPAPSPVPPKHPEQDRRAARGQAEGEDNTSNEEGGQSSLLPPAGQCSEPSLTWVHVAPILSLPKALHAGAVAARADDSAVVAVALPTVRGSPATQDSSVSSTTPHKQPKNQRRPPPVANQQTPCPWQKQAPPVTVKPLSRLCPAPSET